jgi:hypothetical protein
MKLRQPGRQRQRTPHVHPRLVKAADTDRDRPTHQPPPPPDGDTPQRRPARVTDDDHRADLALSIPEASTTKTQAPQSLRPAAGRRHRLPRRCRHTGTRNRTKNSPPPTAHDSRARLDRHERWTNDTKLDSILAGMTGADAKVAADFRVVWDQFKATRDDEIIPAIHRGNADHAKKIADGIQLNRLSKMWHIMSCR